MQIAKGAAAAAPACARRGKDDARKQPLPPKVTTKRGEAGVWFDVWLKDIGPLLFSDIGDPQSSSRHNLRGALPFFLPTTLGFLGARFHQKRMAQQHTHNTQHKRAGNAGNAAPPPLPPPPASREKTSVGFSVGVVRCCCCCV